VLVAVELALRVSQAGESVLSMLNVIARLNAAPAPQFATALQGGRQANAQY
jgi:hypothetical protein